MKTIKIHGVDRRDKAAKIERLFDIVGPTSGVGNYPALSISNHPDEKRYIVKRDGQIQIADIDLDSPDFNKEPFKNYRFVSDLNDEDLDSFMKRIAEDVKDFKGVMEKIKKEEDRAEIAELFVPQIDEDEETDPDDPEFTFCPKID